ncbi:MAG: hypothetical protein JXR70_12685 [Spirochaetales bacterium]|nr:hypothetical protein [Spirochaetales bacterium]
MPCYTCQSTKDLKNFQYMAGTRKSKNHIRVQNKILDFQLCPHCFAAQKKANRKKIWLRILMAFMIIGVLSLFINIFQFHRLMGLYPFILLFTFLGLLDILGRDDESLALLMVNSKNYNTEYPVLYQPEKLKRMAAAQFFAVDIEYID